MMQLLFPKHPMKWTIILGLVGILVITAVGRPLAYWSTETVKIWTGATLLTIMFYQAKLLMRKILGKQIDRKKQDLHRWASYLAIFLLCIHLTDKAGHWYGILLTFCLITIASAYFSRSIHRPASRQATYRQIFIHSIFGAATLAAAIPHAIIALAFE
jgi:hypothetical protein